MSKTAEIQAKLQAGHTPKGLLEQGYKRGLVYKVNKMLRAGHLCKGTIKKAGHVEEQGLPLNIDDDPEVQALMKKLRKAKLEKQIAQIETPVNFEQRLSELEVCVGEVLGMIEDMPFANLVRDFKCPHCGAKHLVAVKLLCTSCQHETSRGWWPEDST